ncbi:MAG: outer membrane beta-barrel protein [Myxococcota bacterium]
MVRRGIVLSCIGALAVLLTAGQAHAQEETAYGLEAGDIGLRFNVPNSSGASVTGQYQLTKPGALQFELGFGFQAEDTDQGVPSGWGIKVGGHYAHYLLPTRVSPYVKAGLTLAQNGGDANEGNDDFNLSIDGGVGVEFFVTEKFTLGGEMLLAIPVAPSFKVGTTTSTLFATFYFGGD